MLYQLTDSGRLIDVVPEPRVRYDAGTDLVPAEPGCPSCGATLERRFVWQDSLIRGGGYGGTRRVESDQCPCGWERVVAVATERPPR